MKSKYFSTILLIGMLAATARLQSQESTGNPFAQAKFVPDISLILDSSFVPRDLDDEWFNALWLPGFSYVGAEDRAAELDETNMEQGFNFNYAELSLDEQVGGSRVNAYALVDDQWDPHTIMARYLEQNRPEGGTR